MRMTGLRLLPWLGAALLASAAAADETGRAGKGDALECLAVNIYFEARADDAEGQAAVAHVTLNRVASPAFPDTVCGVVHQGGEARDQCQFSWWCDGRPDTPANADAWREALARARAALQGESRDPTRGAVYFHHVDVTPEWALALQEVARIGDHRFYAAASP